MNRIFFALVIFHTLAGAVGAQSLINSPPMVGVGGDLTVIGEEFPTGAPDVELRLRDGTGMVDIELTTFVLEGADGFAATVTVPDVAPGAYLVDAFNDFGLAASAPLTVRPELQISLQPNSGPPGTKVMVTVDQLTPGFLRLQYDGVTVLGPLSVDGSTYSGTFLVPADRPVPLGQTVSVHATNTVGTRVSGQGSVIFKSAVPSSRKVTFSNVILPAGIVRRNAPFLITGTMQVPAGEDVTAYELTLGWERADGSVVPINPNPAAIQASGKFQIEGLVLGAVRGLPLRGGDVGGTGTTDLGLYYRNPNTGETGRAGIGKISYELFDLQNFVVRVVDLANNPINDAIVVISTNAFNGLLTPLAQGKRSKALKPGESDISSVLTDPFNQYSSSYFNLITGQPATIEQTGCPVTLVNGLTGPNNSTPPYPDGEFHFEVTPEMSEFAHSIAQSISELDINTTVPAPGKATFRIRINAMHLGHADLADGRCRARRFDFQYDWDTDTWFQRDGPEGDFTIEFNPNSPLVVPLGDCTGDSELPADPYIYGLVTVPSTGDRTARILGLRSFPEAGNVVSVATPPSLKIAHDATVFGAISDLTLYFDGQPVGQMVPGPGDDCSGDAITYAIDLPQLPTIDPGPDNEISAQMTGSTPIGDDITKNFTIQVTPGPEWFNDAGAFAARQVQWETHRQFLIAAEHGQSVEANVQNVGAHVGDLDNDNDSGGVVRHNLTLSGQSRIRNGANDAMAANQDGENTGVTSASTAQDEIQFGQAQLTLTGGTSNVVIEKGGGGLCAGLLTIVDTGKIPLFRYAWGIPPIASATVGADIWFLACYGLKNGSTRLFDQAVATSYEAVAKAQAGLDLFFDLSVILDLVSLTAFAIPNFALEVPVKVVDNFGVNVQQCFNFALNIAYTVSVGWCDLCISASDNVNLFRVAKPGGCVVSGALTANKGLPAVTSADRTSVAADNFGNAMLVHRSGPEMIAQLLRSGQFVAQLPLDTGAGAGSPDTAFYQPNRAVAVWSQNSLPESEFLTKTLTEGLLTQHLVYSLFDGADFGPTLPLTSPSTGDGGVVLASCPSDDSLCPAGGEVLAVWSRDQAGDFNRHQYRLFYSRFDGVSWTAPMPVDGTSTAKDSQPAAAYLEGEPVVVWVRNPGVQEVADGQGGMTVELNLDQRHFMYRFLDQPAGPKEILSLPSGVASPSLAASGDVMILAFSEATEPEGTFFGNRRALRSARGFNCFQGECSWGPNFWLDTFGREIHVERPVIAIDANQHATIVFRHMGYTQALPGDAPGAITGTGEQGKIEFELGSLGDINEADVGALTTDGQVNWHGDAVLDTATGVLITSTVKEGQALELKHFAAMDHPKLRAAGVTAKALGDGVFVNQIPRLAEFELLSAHLTEEYIFNEWLLSLSVAVRNNGTHWGNGFPVRVEATWDGPPGVGTLAAFVDFDALTPGVPESDTVMVQLPSSFHEDDTHLLYVTVNPGQTQPEADGSNNTTVLTFGQMPVVQNLQARAEEGKGPIFLSWDAASDPRLAGYRVYRTNPDQSVRAVGVSETTGFVDLSAYPNQSYRYHVTTFSDRLVESPPSASVSASTVTDALFMDGFES